MSGNRRIAPASSKPGNASVSLPTSSTANFKPDQKIQLGGQIINVSDLQGILKSMSFVYAHTNTHTNKHAQCTHIYSRGELI